MNATKEVRLYAVLLARDDMQRAIAQLPKDEPIVAKLTDALARTKPEPMVAAETP